MLRSYLSPTGALHSFSAETWHVKEKLTALVSLGWEELASTHAITHKDSEFDWVVIATQTKNPSR